MNRALADTRSPSRARRLAAALALVVGVAASVATSPPRIDVDADGEDELTDAAPAVTHRFAVTSHVDGGRALELGLECCVTPSKNAEGARLRVELSTTAENERGSSEMALEPASPPEANATAPEGADATLDAAGEGASEPPRRVCARARVLTGCDPASCERRLTTRCELVEAPAGAQLPVSWRMYARSDYDGGCLDSGRHEMKLAGPLDGP